MSKRLVSAIYSDFFPFDTLQKWDSLEHSSSPNILKEGDTLVVWGGQDISPALYGKKKSAHTWADDRPSSRDMIEWEMMKRAKSLGCPIIGVCRGAQMLCALAGGHLIQHVNSHGGRHAVITIDGEEIITNSIHHQMMYPWNVNHIMLASIKEPLSDVHLDVDTNIPVPEEPECVFFPEVNGLAIQWHPEMMQANSPATEFVFSKYKEYVCGC